MSHFEVKMSTFHTTADSPLAYFDSGFIFVPWMELVGRDAEYVHGVGPSMSAFKGGRVSILSWYATETAVKTNFTSRVDTLTGTAPYLSRGSLYGQKTVHVSPGHVIQAATWMQNSVEPHPPLETAR